MTSYGLYLRTFMLVIIATGFMVSCASTNVTERRDFSGDGTLQRPSRVIVYHFAATPDEIESGAAISGYYKKRGTPQTAKQIKLGRELGDIIAQEMVREILKMGMPAEHASSGSAPGIGDLLIKGEFVSIDEGDRLKRMLIGFGAGAGELRTHVESYQISAEGHVLLGTKQIKAKGGKMPGIFVPVMAGAMGGSPGKSAMIAGGANVAQEMGPESIQAAAKRTAKEIVKVLRENFRRQGWI